MGLFLRVCVCVCLCVRAWEYYGVYVCVLRPIFAYFRERERERERENVTADHLSRITTQY